jgi:uncharacterized membrane protein
MRWRRAVPSLVAVAAIGLLALLPDIGPQVRSDNQAILASHGRIVEIVPRRADEPIRPPIARVEILDGPTVGSVVQAYLEGPGGSQIVANYQPGDEVVVTTTRDQDGNPYLAVSDRWRAPLLGLFVLVFAAAVVVVGGLRGFRALLSLGLTIALIIKVLIPLVVSGVAPVPLAVITAITVTVVTILLTEGWSRTSGAAILGTAGALALTGLLSAIATALASFTYSAGSDLAFLQTADGKGLDLRGMLLAAFILGGVGVLDDVTVTQAALVGSLADHGARGRRLIEAALDVGRSHIAATVNTLFLAYVGAGLPLIVTILVSRQPSDIIFNSEIVATEVIRTIVGSLGIVAAVPFTTLVAAVLVEGPDQARKQGSERRRLAWLVGSTAVIAAVLAATAVLPLGQGREPLAVERFGPSSVPASPSGRASVSPAPSLEPDGSSAANPDLVQVGTPFVFPGSDSAAHVTVTDLKTKAVANGFEITIIVSYQNFGPAPFFVDPSAWSLATSGGEAVAMAPGPTSGLEGGDLPSGGKRSGTLVGTVASAPDQTFVFYSDPYGVVLFAVPVA